MLAVHNVHGLHCIVHIAQGRSSRASRAAALSAQRGPAMKPANGRQGDASTAFETRKHYALRSARPLSEAADLKPEGAVASGMADKRKRKSAPEAPLPPRPCKIACLPSSVHATPALPPGSAGAPAAAAAARYPLRSRISLDGTAAAGTWPCLARVTQVASHPYTRRGALVPGGAPQMHTFLRAGRPGHALLRTPVTCRRDPHAVASFGDVPVDLLKVRFQIVSSLQLP